MKRFASVLGIAASILITVASARADDTVRIGVISSRSGPFAALGQQGDEGDQLAADEINKAGGILGRKVELIFTDDTSQASETSRLFRELAAKNVVAILGNTDFGDAATALAKELKVPYIAAALGYSRDLTEEKGHRYFFRLIANARAYYGPFAERVAKEKHDRWCTIGLDIAYAHDMTPNVLAFLKKNNPATSVIDGCEFWVPFATTDFSPYITAILSKKPDALLFGGVVGPGLLPFINQANSFGLFGAVPSVHPALGWPGNNEGLRKEDIPENIITAGDFIYPPPADRPSAQAFIDAYKSRFGALPWSEALRSYVALKFVKAALDKAGRVDREAFVDAAEGLTVEDPVQGPITVRPFDHQATVSVWVGKLTWDEKDGRPGLADAHFVPSSGYLPTADQIKALRAKSQ
jgi:branched-chain amino acid transport system substrate-binding protein